MTKKIQAPYRIAVLLVVGAVIGLFIPLLSLLCVLGLATWMLRKLKTLSFLESLAAGVLLVFVNSMIVYSVVTLLRLHLPVRYAFSVQLVLLTAFAAYTYWHHPKFREPGKWIAARKSDYCALGAAIIIGLLLLVPIAKQSGAGVAQFMSYGEDNAAHYALTRYIYHHGDYTYNYTAAHLGLIDSLQIYPQGFHLTAATLVSAFSEPLHINEAGFVKLYGFVVTMLYALFIFWFLKLCLLAAEGLPWKIVVTITPALGLIAGLGVFLLLLDRGFQPQIFAYIYLTAAAYIATVSHQKSKQAEYVLYLLILLSIAVAASWWFLLIVMLALVLTYALFNVPIPQVFANLRKFTFVKLLAIFAILYPVVINVLLDTKTDPIDEPGGVDQLPTILFAYFIPLIIVAFVFALLRWRHTRYVVSALVASIFILVAIGAYMLIRIGHFEYFFYKSVYAVLLYAVALFGIAAAVLLRWLHTRYGSRVWVPWLTCLVIATLTVVVSVRTNLVEAKVYIHNWYPWAATTNDMAPLFSPAVSQYSDVLYVGDCNVARDYLSNRWSGARLFSENDLHSHIETGMLSGDFKTADKLITAYVPTEKHLLIVANGGCLSKLPTTAALLANPPENLTVQYMSAAGAPIPPLHY